MPHAPSLDLIFFRELEDGYLLAVLTAMAFHLVRNLATRGSGPAKETK